MAIIYKGFGTVGQTSNFRLTDFELAKRDLLNHFNIRKGEKLMNPNFGTLIWNVIHDPLTEELKGVILDDIKTIINSDPRIAVDNVVITEFASGIRIALDLRYVLTNQLDKMNITFDNANSSTTEITNLLTT
jgi:phage baseplate assembly protein W